MNMSPMLKDAIDKLILLSGPSNDDGTWFEEKKSIILILKALKAREGEALARVKLRVKRLDGKDMNGVRMVPLVYVLAEIDAAATKDKEEGKK